MIVVVAFANLRFANLQTFALLFVVVLLYVVVFKVLNCCVHIGFGVILCCGCCGCCGSNKSCYMYVVLDVVVIVLVAVLL